MEISIAGQTLAFIESIICGAALGVVFDLFKLTRKIIKNKIIIAVEDIIFLVICALTSFSFMLRVSSGEIRIFIILGIIIGFIMYYFSVSVIVNKIFDLLEKLLKGFFKIVKIIIFIPIYKIMLFFIRIIHKMAEKPYKLLKKVMRNFGISLKSTVTMMYNKETIRVNRKSKAAAKKRKVGKE